MTSEVHNRSQELTASANRMGQHAGGMLHDRTGTQQAIAHFSAAVSFFSFLFYCWLGTLSAGAAGTPPEICVLPSCWCVSLHLGGKETSGLSRNSIKSGLIFITFYSVITSHFFHFQFRKNNIPLVYLFLSWNCWHIYIYIYKVDVFFDSALCLVFKVYCYYYFGGQLCSRSA